MAMVGADSGSLQAGSQPKSFGLVWGSAATWCCSTFIRWTGWTLAMVLPWWQNHKHWHLYYQHTGVLPRSVNGVSEMTYNVSSGMLNTTMPYHTIQ